MAYQHDLFPKIISLPEGFKDIDELANTAEGKNKFDDQRKKSQDGFYVIFQNLKNKFDITSPIDKQKILNVLFGLILNINSSAMQDHYIQLLGEKIGTAYEIMRTQYVQFAKNEGRFILQQNSRKKEPSYEIHREMLISALFYQDFIQQFIETKDTRSKLLELISAIHTNMPENKINTTHQDPTQHENLLEFQLRREKEIGDIDEEKKYHAIKKIILPTLQGYVQRITKDQNISNDIKQETLNILRKI